MDKELGEDAFNVAYDAIYGLVEKIYTKYGHIENQLNGLMFKDGDIASVTKMVVHSKEEAFAARNKMISMFHMVAQISEAWVVANDPKLGKNDATGKEIIPSQHPDRKDTVMIMLFTKDIACMANCLVNPKKKTIQRGELVVPEAISGKFGWTGQERKMNS